MNIANSVIELIGNTPMVRLSKKTNPYDADVLVKLEYFNPMSSIKDRVGVAMLEDAQARGIISPGATIIEPTSGNTGIGLAFACAVKGYHLILTMPETMSIERRKILSALGVEIVLTEAYKNMEGAVEKAQEIHLKTPNSWIPNQFENNVNTQAHRDTTAKEIIRDTDGKVDIFVAGVGTGGTITGIGEVIKEHNPEAKVVAVEPLRSAVLSGEQAYPHRIQGIGAGFIPKILNQEIYDEILLVTDEDSSKYAHLLSENEGILAGISGAANVWAALELASRPENSGKTIVTVLPDSGERYLSTWLYDEFAINQEEDNKENIQNEIENNLDTSLPKSVALSLRYFQNGLFCSEAVLRGFNEAYNLGLSEEQYKISTAFAGGMGEAGCACGAVTGCVMAISLIAGRNHNYESERVAFTATQKLHDEFREKHKALCCRVLTNNFTWNTVDHKLNCEDLVRDAALITNRIILEDLKEYLPENGGKGLEERSRIHRNPDSIRL
jgi:cysteine synthase A